MLAKWCCPCTGGWVRASVRAAAEWAMLANGCWKKQTGEGAQKRTLTSTDISPLTKLANTRQLFPNQHIKNTQTANRRANKRLRTSVGGHFSYLANDGSIAPVTVGLHGS